MSSSIERLILLSKSLLLAQEFFGYCTLDQLKSVRDFSLLFETSSHIPLEQCEESIFKKVPDITDFYFKCSTISESIPPILSRNFKVLEVMEIEMDEVGEKALISILMNIPTLKKLVVFVTYITTINKFKDFFGTLEINKNLEILNVITASFDVDIQYIVNFLNRNSTMQELYLSFVPLVENQYTPGSLEIYNNSLKVIDVSYEGFVKLFSSKCKSEIRKMGYMLEATEDDYTFYKNVVYKMHTIHIENVTQSNAQWAEEMVKLNSPHLKRVEVYIYFLEFPRKFMVDALLSNSFLKHVFIRNWRQKDFLAVFNHQVTIDFYKVHLPHHVDMAQLSECIKVNSVTRELEISIGTFTPPLNVVQYTQYIIDIIKSNNTLTHLTVSSPPDSALYSRSVIEPLVKSFQDAIHSNASIRKLQVFTNTWLLHFKSTLDQHLIEYYYYE
ncbi:hypothetical protein DLAC_05784 [Tieghemostelium lacteum]|uniref:Uncharacterized protein n=1 Tax=Tieghemostelium lacteum TaxID=361077 RepID=A0A151ZGP9_TIELA|nr:hypothetical protein DLAC_05784 [Tieghemostelium lacteum]|eukprot:KYQ93151.1 hypothetical protein DLAC_05784 [Tieghemostelium lacteum]